MDVFAHLSSHRHAPKTLDFSHFFLFSFKSIWNRMSMEASWETRSCNQSWTAMKGSSLYILWGGGCGSSASNLDRSDSWWDFRPWKTIFSPPPLNQKQKLLLMILNPPGVNCRKWGFPADKCHFLHKKCFPAETWVFLQKKGFFCRLPPLLLGIHPPPRIFNNKIERGRMHRRADFWSFWEVTGVLKQTSKKLPENALRLVIST